VAEGVGLQRVVPWISRRRVTAGFVLGAIVLWFAEPTPSVLAAGAAIAAAGEAVRIWAAGHLEKGREVTSSGPYAFTRHPLYVGSSLIGAGMAIATGSILAASVIGVFLIVTFSAAIWTEEAHLTEKFGSEYPAYRDGRRPTVIRRFSLQRAIRNREYRALTGLVLVLAVLAWKASRR
jgi:protein-S-isoprenylcysteine O-methyltransferase Ste14